MTDDDADEGQHAFAVTVKDEDAAEPITRRTRNMDEALDWFTNAATEVVENESPFVFASIEVDGVIWGEIREGGIEPMGDGGGGEVVQLPTPRRRRAA
jgi:hypothetical protein